MTNATPPEDLYHLGVKALIRDPEGKVLLLKVNPAKLGGNHRGAYWDIPGGRVQRGSTVEDTLRRELAEETGLTARATRPFAMTLSNIRIPLAPHDVGLVLSVYLCDVDDASAITLSDEHTDCAWHLPSDAASPPSKAANPMAPLESKPT